MHFKHFILNAAIVMALGGCDRDQTLVNPPVTNAPPATAPVVAATDPTEVADAQIDAPPATEPTDTEPFVAASFLTINGKLTRFPKAMLTLRTNTGGTGLSAVLFTDDPPSAINDNYSGNSYYLPMTLDIEDPQEIGTARWQYKALHTDRVETPDGIFLDGHKQQLQPLDVQVQFNGKPPQVSVSIVGRFLLVNSIKEDNPVVPEMTQVMGKLDATVAGK